MSPSQFEVGVSLMQIPESSAIKAAAGYNHYHCEYSCIGCLLLSAVTASAATWAAS